MLEKRKVMTLCIIHQRSRVLLGMKKRGFGAGRWNGFGGKVKEGETIEESAFREIKEEVGIIPLMLEKAGVINFRFQNKPEVLEVHIFRAGGIQGVPVETEEMRPQWFAEDEIPFHAMWPDDIYWIPLFLAGKKFRGEFLFDESGQVVLQKELIEVSMI